MVGWVAVKARSAIQREARSTSLAGLTSMLKDLGILVFCKVTPRKIRVRDGVTEDLRYDDS